MTEPQNGANGNNGANGRDAKADPTALTTDALEREIKHLRELIEARLDQMDIALVEARSTSEKAVEAARITALTAVAAAIDAAKTAIVEFDASITRRLVAAEQLNAAQFVTYRTLLDSNAEKVALALDASNKAVEKAEIFNEKRFDLLTKQIDELKAQAQLTAGANTGRTQLWSLVVGGIGLAATIIFVILAFNN